jgi:hypothetical protein
VNDKQKQGRDRISELMDELIPLIGPSSNVDVGEVVHDHDGHEYVMPPGPWMVSAWVVSIDYVVMNSDDETETWSVTMRSKGCPRTQAVGMAMNIKQAFE